MSLAAGVLLAIRMTQIAISTVDGDNDSVWNAMDIEATRFLDIRTFTLSLKNRGPAQGLLPVSVTCTMYRKADATFGHVWVPVRIAVKRGDDKFSGTFDQKKSFILDATYTEPTG